MARAPTVHVFRRPCTRWGADDPPLAVRVRLRHVCGRNYAWCVGLYTAAGAMVLEVHARQLHRALATFRRERVTVRL